MSVLGVPGIIRGGQIEKLGDGERATFTVGAAQAATGGLGVESMAGDRVVRIWQVGSVVTQGVAIHDAAAAAKVTVAMMGVWLMTASGVIGAGSRVIPGAAGVVVVAGAAPDSRTIVGRNLADATDTTLTPIKIA